MLVGGMYQVIAPCVFVGLECVGYLVNCFVVSSYAKGLLCVGGCKWRVGVNFMVWAKCAIGVGIC